jgi:DNA-binding response OmpR family regulator
MPDQIFAVKDNVLARLLVVNDNVDVADTLTRFLRREGYGVSTAVNGREALEIIQQQPPDLILLDVSIPELDVLTVCQRLKEDERTALIPIIVLTGFDDRKQRTQAIESGADDVLVKPFEQSLLRARIRALLRTKRLTDKLLTDKLTQHETEQLFTDTDPDSTSPDTVEMTFNFPEAVKIPCEQYLLYFIEFLKDIGIDATADLREDAGKVLFSVTPKDKDEALDNIREALEIYLRLPVNRNTTVVVSPETSIEVQKLSAQIHHLQGQLYLASAALQQKQLTIQQRDITIEHQQALIQQQIASGQVLVQALQRNTMPSR